MQPSKSSLEHACAWVDAHLDEFRIDLATGQKLPSLKALAELAHAGEILARRGSERGTRWVAHAWKATAEGALITQAIRAHPRLVLAATTLVPFHLAGYTNADAVQALQDQHPRAALNPFEWNLVLTSFGALGLELVEDVRIPARNGSIVAKRVPAANLSLEAVYLLIHECLYRSAWGRDRDLPWCDASDRANLEVTLAALGSRFRDDADVAAEVLMATHTVRGTCGASALWETLARAQADDGAVMPPEREITQLARPGGFARAYHTTLVSIMAWGLCDHAFS